MLKEILEINQLETLRGHILRSDIPGPGKILFRYYSNGVKNLEEFYKDPNSRCIVDVPIDHNQDIVIFRPCMLKFNSNFKKKLFIKSERVFVDGNNFCLEHIEIITNRDCFLETNRILTKILIADSTIKNLIVNQANNLIIIDCEIKKFLKENVVGLMRIQS